MGSILHYRGPRWRLPARTSCARCAALLLRAPRSSLRCPEGRADDAGVVLQLSDHDFRAYTLDQRNKFVRLSAHAAADDEQIRPQQGLEMAEIFRQPSRPVLPGQVFAFPGRVGGLQFGVLAVDLQMPEFGVGYQRAVEEERAANSGAERKQRHRAGDVTARPIEHLRE